MAGEPATALATSDLSIATTSLSLILPQESRLPLVSSTLPTRAKMRRRIEAGAGGAC
jgi:hypothetical protein